MRYEVEQKFRVADTESIHRAMADRDISPRDTVTQVDTYYAHPVRDFAATDEALRIRRVGEENVVTYKGPKIDATTKTRQEIELAIAAGQQGAEQAGQLLEALGFRRVADVSKVRQTYCLEQEGQSVEIAVDNIEGLGSFVELEIVAEGEQALDPARQTIATLATELGLAKVERRSYLELLLEHN
ncbi:MAG: class IV adenylate cyclase [Planctomycetes bacterium]|nr:class IV adenylate cyclase [Planctomycetota bacterium]